MPACAVGSAVAGDRDQAIDKIGGRRRAAAADPSAAGWASPAPRRSGCGSGRVDARRTARASRRGGCGTARSGDSMPRRGERGAGDLLGVEAVRDALRRIAAHGQRARHGLAGELVAEAGSGSRRSCGLCSLLRGAGEVAGDAAAGARISAVTGRSTTGPAAGGHGRSQHAATHLVALDRSRTGPGSCPRRSPRCPCAG